MKARSTHPTRLSLGGLLLAVAGTFALTAEAAPMGMPGGPGAHGSHGGHGMHGGGMPMMHLSERALDRINASPEQRTQLKAIMESARKDLDAQRDGRRALREHMAQLFTQPSVDARAAEALRQQMLGQHDLASRRMMQAMIDASRVLSPEQRAQLASLMKQRGEMMERHKRERQTLEAPKS